jgi:hypothetical protein
MIMGIAAATAPGAGLGVQAGSCVCGGLGMARQIVSAGGLLRRVDIGHPDHRAAVWDQAVVGDVFPAAETAQRSTARRIRCRLTSSRR